MTEGIAILKLPPTLDPRAAQPLLDSLLALRAGPVAVDASAVERAGTPCLQVLLAAAAAWKSDGMAFRIAAPSPEFAKAVSLLGLTLEQLPMEQPAT